MMVLDYWINNVVGLMIIRYGHKNLTAKDASKKYTCKDFYKDILISLFFTGIIIVCIQFGWLRFPMDYFQK